MAALLIGVALPAKAAESKVALVVGNAQYAGAERLVNPLHDAADMCAALQRLGYQTLCHTDVRDRQQFLDLLQAFAARLTPGSKGLFYYAGHAVQIRGENYLVPTQVRVQKPADVETTLVGVHVVLEHLKRASSDFNMVILDACRTNPFLEVGAPARAAGGLRGMRVVLAKAAQDVAYGLGAIRDAPVGAIVLYATAAEEAAFDGDGRNGPLTKHILAHIETPGIAVEELIKRVTLGVQNETLKTIGRRQTPFVYSSFSGEFCFAGCAAKIDPNEVERLRKERSDLARRLQDSDAAKAQKNKEQTIFVPPAL
jgi:uncharacterized caspase-like protein